jgi:hypothetical protein
VSELKQDKKDFVAKLEEDKRRYRKEKGRLEEEVEDLRAEVGSTC